ncbi:MAG: hypothetical protein HOC63_16800 [Rhodospirillales bacterium]|jgi:hypothetical protein|nr:hypothetical protein [Rhodospirillales bacterium]
MALKPTSLKIAKFLVFMLVVSMLTTQLFKVHFHVYDHQHEFDGQGAHQAFSHSDLEQSEPGHHQGTVIIETAQSYFAKVLKFQPNIGSVFLACLLLLLFLPPRTITIRPGTYLFWNQRFLLPPPARAPPWHNLP